MEKMYAFSIIKNAAGNDIHRLSLTFILTATPKSISKARPPAEINKIMGIFKPMRRPTAPSISNNAVIAPTFSSPKRLNSIFIWGNTKYAMP